MKLFRLILVCSLFVLSVTPSYAIGCKSCTGPTTCESTPDSGTKCQRGVDWCNTIEANCTGFTEESASAVLAEWTVVSIEISRPAEGTKVVTSPAAIAEAGLSQAAAKK